MPANPCCETCGTTLGPRSTGKGRPRQYCEPLPGEKASKCAMLAKRLREVAKLADEIVASTTSTTKGRAVYRIRMALETVRDDVLGPR